MDKLQLYRFKKVVADRFLSPIELVRQSGLSKTFIYSLFNGENKKRHYGSVVRLCRFLGPDWEPEDFL